MDATTALIDLVAGRRGHFLLESGHHGDLWLDLDGLFLRPAGLRAVVRELGERLAATARPDAICGPLVGGAFIAYSIADALDLEFFPAEPLPAAGTGLYTARYGVPQALHGRLAGRRVAVVDDVVNAGSAIRGTVASLRAANASVAAIGALIVLGTLGADFARDEHIPLTSVAALPNHLWEPAACPLCAAGEPLEDVRAASA